MKKGKEKFIVRLLVSIPVILISLYFIPFLGICLILLRFILYNNKKESSVIILLLIGFLILLPTIINTIINLFNLKSVIFLNNIINNNLYSMHLIRYAKLLIFVSIISYLLSCIFKIF